MVANCGEGRYSREVFVYVFCHLLTDIELAGQGLLPYEVRWTVPCMSKETDLWLVNLGVISHKTKYCYTAVENSIA